MQVKYKFSTTFITRSVLVVEWYYFSTIWNVVCKLSLKKIWNLLYLAVSPSNTYLSS